MSYIKIIITIFIISLVIIFSSCTKPVSEQRQLPVERIIKRLEDNKRTITSLIASGSLYVKADNFNNSASIEINLKKPDSLKVSIFGPFGIEVGNALAGKNKIIFVNNLNSEVIEAGINKGNIKKILKMDLEYSDLLDLLIGNTKLPAEYNDELNYQIDGDKYLLQFKDNGKFVKIWVDIRYLSVSKYSVSPDGNTLEYTVIFDKFIDRDGTVIPTKITYQDFVYENRIEINYSDIKINPEQLDLNLFIPEDADIKKW